MSNMGEVEVVETKIHCPYCGSANVMSVETWTKYFNVHDKSLVYEKFSDFLFYQCFDCDRTFTKDDIDV